jgi:hypothetical protein
MNVLREAVYTVWSTQHEVRQPCTLTLSSHMSLSGTFMALDHMQHMPSWSLARSFENNWKVLNFFLWRLFAFWAAFSFSSFPSLTMTRMSINVFLLSMIASWLSLRSTKSNKVVSVSHKRECEILLLLNFFQMLNMFSMQLDASQLATNNIEWKAMTVLVNSEPAKVSRTQVLVFGGMLCSLRTFDTRVAARVVALQDSMWMTVETSGNGSPAPGGWHFIPHKRCRHFGQFAYACVTPIWVCKMQLFKPTCALLTKENCSHSSASCTRHGANLSNLKRYEKQDRHQIWSRADRPIVANVPRSAARQVQTLQIAGTREHMHIDRAEGHPNLVDSTSLGGQRAVHGYLFAH